MTVAAVIPTVGRPELRRAVASVLAQSVPAIPVVVLDRPERIGEVAQLLNGLEHQLVVTEGGRGGSHARNLGVERSSSDVVALLDDDDEWLPRKLETQLELLANYPGAVIASRAELVGRKTRALPERVFTGEHELSSYLLERSTIRLRRNFIQSSTLLMNRDVASAHPWPEHLRRHQDWGVLISMHRAGVPIVTSPETLTRVYQGSAGSISRSTAWQASMAWLSEFAFDASPRSQADFLCSIVLRGALKNGDWKAIPPIAARAARLRPHTAAVIVALSGIVDR